MSSLATIRFGSRPYAVHRHGIHRGEERYVQGNRRAGMVVFAGCHLRCSFCYTPEASFEGQGQVRDLETVLGELADRGAENFNLISPTHIWSQIRAPLERVRTKYPHIPLVLKVSGYEGQRLAREFAEVADVVVMDFKVFSEQAAQKVNLPRVYGQVAKSFLEALHPRLPYRIGADGTVERGILIRTLWLPMAPGEAISIGQCLNQMGWTGAWNLMRNFVDPEQRRLLSASAGWESQVRAALPASIPFEIWKGGLREQKEKP